MTNKVFNHRAQPSARHLRDIRDAAVAMHVMEQSFGDASAVVIRNLIEHRPGTLPANWACDTSLPGWRRLRGTVETHYGADAEMIQRAYSAASVYRTPLSTGHGWNVDGKYDWVTGGHFLRLQTALAAAGGRMPDANYNWNMVFGEQLWYENNAAVGVAPAGFVDPADGKSYSAWADPSGLSCCGNGSCVDWMPFGPGAGWENLIAAGEGVVSYIDMWVSPGDWSGDNFVGATTPDGELPKWALIRGAGRGIELPLALKVTDPGDITIEGARVEIESGGLIKTRHTYTCEWAGDHYASTYDTETTTQGIGLILLGRRIGRDANTGYPVDIWEPCGGGPNTTTITNGKVSVMDCTELCQQMHALKGSYKDFCVLPGTAASYVNMESPGDVLHALLPPQVDDEAFAGLDPGTPHVHYKYETNSGSSSEWFDGSGDRCFIDSAYWETVSWSSFALVNPVIDVSFGVGTLDLHVPYFNMPRF